jgi:hypothetical protein
MPSFGALGHLANGKALFFRLLANIVELFEEVI